MLKAITSGKSGRIPDGVRPGDPWATAIKQREDLLTSSVFEKMAYLRPATLWAILRGTFDTALADYRLVELETFEFWPRWDDPTTGGTVEPDVFAEFTVGDPSRRIAIIFEAKLGQQQYAWQWQRQWSAYRALLNNGEANADEVFLLAIGGLTGHRIQVAEKFRDAISIETAGEVTINAAAADWRRLADVVFDHRSVASRTDSRILTDIGEALALFGYRHVQSLSSLQSFVSPTDGLASLKTLQEWKFEHV
jgi:hypothetical protein